MEKAIYVQYQYSMLGIYCLFFLVETISPKNHSPRLLWRWPQGLDFFGFSLVAPSISLSDWRVHNYEIKEITLQGQRTAWPQMIL